MRGPSGKCSNPTCSQRATAQCSKTGFRYCGELCRRQCQGLPPLQQQQQIFQGSIVHKSPIQQTVVNVVKSDPPPVVEKKPPSPVEPIAHPLSSNCGVLPPKQGQTQMTFSAVGEEEVSPDKAVIKFVLITKSRANDKRAMEEHTGKKNAFTRAVASNLPKDGTTAGDPEVDTGVKSDDFALTPVWDYESKPPRLLEYMYKSDVVVVFQARHFGLLSQFVSALSGTSGVFVEYVNFVSKDNYVVARERATRDAKEGAESCARAIGYGLLEIVKIEYEDDRYGGGGGAMYSMAPRALKAESASAPEEGRPVVMELQPGKKLLRSTCTMTVLLGQT